MAKYLIQRGGVALGVLAHVKRHQVEAKGTCLLDQPLQHAVCHVPDGAHPSFAIGYSTRDNDFYKEWDTIARDRDRFAAWIDEHVMVHA